MSILAIITSSVVVWGMDSAAAQSDDEIDVFLIAGQSNGAYSFRADPETATPVSKTGVAYYFGTNTAPVPYDSWDSSATYGIYDMVNPDGTAKIGGIEQPFATTYYNETKHKICMINVCVGGAKMVDWSMNQVYYVWAQEVFTKAMAALTDAGFAPESVNLIWIQGESDPTWQIQAYQNRFITMFESMDHTGTYGYFNDDYIFDNCIMSLVRQHRGQNTCISQIFLDANNDNIKLGCIVCDHFTYENGLLYNDDTHYTQLGRNIVAVDLAHNFIDRFQTA